MFINHSKFLSHIIMYSYFPNLTDTTFIKEIILFTKTISRQTPYILFNNKNELVGTKITLRKHKLNIFLYKFKLFSLPVINPTIIGNKNICQLDSNHNISIILKNPTCFFESKTNLLTNLHYTITLHFIFNSSVSVLHKSNYINTILNLTL